MSDEPFHVPLEFHRTIIENNATGGGLFVLARGLGLEKILKTFIHLCADPRVLVYVLSADSEDVGMDFLDTSAQEFIHETAPHIHIIDPETSPKERSLTYDKGGVIILSPRVFLMDLLHNRVPTPLVTGVLVPHAHR